ncbi:MAG: helicase HerA domain-containing protein [Candidatus Woesearchaeota archaeon]
MNRKIDEIGKRIKDKKNMYIGIIVISLLLLSIIGLVALSTFIGNVYQNYMSGQAGYVYEVVLEYRECAYLWSGVFGAAVMVTGYNNPQDLTISSCGMYDTNLLFNCLQPATEHEVMASLVPSTDIDWSSLQAATAADVDAYLEVGPTNLMSATRTFTQTASFAIGAMQYTVPATYTKTSSGNGSNTFDIGLLKDGSGNLIYVAHANTNFSRGFNNRFYNYQMILPVKNGTNPTYYFFTDPNDVCPAGEGELPNSGYVIGNVSGSSGDRLEGVIVDVAGKTAVTDINGAFSLIVPAGAYYIFGIKTGYQAYYGNVTVAVANTTAHNFVMILEAVPNPNTGTGVGPGQDDGPGQDVGPGEDVSSGEAPRVPIVEQPRRIEGIDYVISISRIDRKLIIGNFLQEIVSFYSYKQGSANLKFTIEGDSNLTNMVKLDKSAMSIAPNTNDQLTLTIFGEGIPGVYNGSLLIEGDLNEKIPIRIELLSKDRLPVESLLIMLDIDDKEIFGNQKLKFKTSLHNLLTDQSYPVSLQYTIQNDRGETVWTDHSNVYVQTSFSLLKSATLPENLQTGDYILRVTANYLGLSSGASAAFSIVLPFYEVMFWGLQIKWWILIFVIILLIALAVWFIRRYIQSKKRYSNKVEYSELPKIGPKAAFVGKIAETDHKTYFDLEQFKVHTIVAGATGGGKSVAAQVIVEEALLKNVAVIVFDPTAQWSGMLRKGNDKNMFKLYDGFGMKPSQARAFNGNVRQITNALEIIDVKRYIKPGEIQIFALNKLDPKDIDIFVANSIREVFHANFPETPEIKLLIVYDEVHRLLPKFGGSGEGFLQIERGCREFRKWGVGILMISQVLADFVGQIKANINTEVQMRTRDEGDLDRIKTKYGVDVLQGLVKASVGSGMVENPAYNRGKPYFVSFRPLLHNTQRLPDEELEKYNKYNELISDLEYQIEQLEELKQDVFDLKLQLKLSLDKVKSGNFNMVEIYVQELVPRIEKMWVKLGKSPKKRELKLVDVKALKEEMKKAEDSRKQYEKDNAKVAEATEKKEEKKVLKYDKTVQLNKALNFSNGITVTSLQELIDVMPNITGATFKHHVTASKNDIADWIRDAINDSALSEKIRSGKTNTEYLQILEDDKLKNNKPVSADSPESSVSTPNASDSSVSGSSENPKNSETNKENVEHKEAQAKAFEKMASSASVSNTANTNDLSEDESAPWKDIKEKLTGLDVDQKIRLLERSEKKYDSDLNITLSLGLLYQKRKEFDKAELKYRRAFDINNDNPKALYYLGGLYKIQKNYSQALDYFNKYLAMDVAKSNDPKLKELTPKVKDLVEKIKKKIGGAITDAGK